MDYSTYYNASEEFKRYVDKYCAAKKITVETALSHKHVRIAANYMKEKEEEEKKIIRGEGSKRK